MPSIDEQLKTIRRGADEVLVEAEMQERLQRGVPLRVKAGFDPTAPDLHLGHTVLINKLRQFQELGHQVALPDRRFHRDDRRPDRQERDPPAAYAARKSRDNARTYTDQVFKILDPQPHRGRFQFRPGWTSAPRRT